MLDLVAVLGSYSLLTTAGCLTAHPELWNHINLQPTTATPLQKGPERSCPTASSGSLAPMLCPNASSCVHLQVGKQRGEKPGLGWGRHWSVKINLRNSSRGLAKSESPCWFRVQPAVVLGAAAESIQLPLVELLGSECGMHEAEVQEWRSSSLQERPVLHRSRWEYMSLAAFQTPALLFLPACSPPLQSKH